MGADEAEIACCPKCARPVQARDFMNPALLGLAESVLPQLHCRCGYSGLPIAVARKDYRKFRASRRRPRPRP